MVPSGDPAAKQPADYILRNARTAGLAHVFFPVRGYAVGIQPQRERGFERDERPLALPQYLPRDFTRTNQSCLQPACDIGRYGRGRRGRFGGNGCRSGI